jgi:hypothetical protein
MPADACPSCRQLLPPLQPGQTVICPKCGRQTSLPRPPVATLASKEDPVPSPLPPESVRRERRDDPDRGSDLRRAEFDDDPTKRKQKAASEFWILVAVLGGLALFGCCGVTGLGVWIFSRSSSASSGGFFSFTGPAPEAVEVSAQSLLDDWKQNPVATSKRYKGKTIELRGFVNRFDLRSRSSGAHVVVKKTRTC